MNDHEAFLAQAIDLARQARADGNHPFGALLVVDGRVALAAMNTAVTERNPTAHAEHNLVRAAIQRLSPDEIARGILYTSCEPCAMCAGAMYWAGIRDVVYGLSTEALAKLAGGRFVVPCRDLFGRASDIVRVTGPLLIDEALAVHEGFWPRRERITTAPVASSEIEYSDTGGSGEPLLLVHAGVFADWFAPLAASPVLDGLRVIRVRRAGYGTNAPAAHLSIQDHARHLAALADLLEINTLHVVGHSSGALIACQMAIDRPSLVHTLTLIEPAAAGPFRVPSSAEVGQRAIAPAVEAFAAGDGQRAFDTFMQGVCGEQSREVIEKSLGQGGYAQAVRESQFFFRDELPAVMQWQCDTVGTITQPVLVMEGGDSRKQGPSRPQVTERAKTLFPQAEVALLDGTNHLLPLQDPEGLAELLSDFVRRHPIAPRRT